MARRLLGTIGRPLAFLLVAGLVFAGLGWVTVAALRVEEAQRESARRADREKELRIALWRLDARMLPALGVEDTRPFHEFRIYSPDDPITIYGPASAPLLAGELPDWMQLHFQLDPEGSWESPQVLNATLKTSLRRHWPGLPLRNATKAREVQLASLGAKFPARQVGDVLAARERAFPLISPGTSPLSANFFGFEDGVEPVREVVEPPPPVLAPNPVNAPAAPADGKLGGAEATRPTDKSGAFGFNIPPPIRKSADAEVQQNALAGSQELRNNSTIDNTLKAESKKNRGLDYDERQRVLDEGRNDAARFKYQLVPKLSLQTANGVQQKKLADQNATASTAKSLAGEATDRLGKSDKDGLALNVPQSEYKADALGFYRLLEEARTRELDRKQMENLHRGSLKKEAERKEDAVKDSAKGALAFGRPNSPSGLGALPGAGGAPPPPGLPAAPPRVTAPVAPVIAGPPAAPPRVTAPAAPVIAGPLGDIPPPAGGSGAGGGFSGRIPREPVPPTPDPAPPAMLQPVEPPPILPAFEDAPPVAVHLGTLRPQWLTAPDGTLLLVLVRTARVENKKTLYQGVVLDWAKLQALLHNEVKDLFPEATLVPVKDSNAESREQSMSALPVRLDPGAESPLPPAGWTPLRIGLVLAWAAALIAFAAVGLTGRSLVDLAERRIRFVSAVTHELRTPLTSLRLYLDLLLSGMVQDEEKRREYLSTLNVESDRLHRLIDNVLDFAKLERSRKGRDRQPVKAADLLDSIRLTWLDRVAADGKELVVVSTLPEELGVLTDAALVQQIVGNLIDNARKYTREATDARIWLHAKVESARLVFEVEDRGAGVPPREQKTIFRPFRRGDTADTKAGGAGLGLALSREWAEILGGKLIYRAPEGGVGSTFRLELLVKS